MRFKVTADPMASGFSLIPSGTFTMGRTSGDYSEADNPPVSVNVSAFYMAQKEVTKGQWDAVRVWGAAAERGYTDLPVGDGKAANHPVHSINWHAMVKWCNARSQMEGLVACYRVDDGQIYKTGSRDDVTCNWNANGYRLPTEAEWEKAARGGLSDNRFPWEGTISHSLANYNAYTNYSYDVSPTRGYHPTYNSGAPPYTSPVGSFAPNSYGLYDMAGNLWESCWDWYSSSYYSVSPRTDPRGATSDSGHRMLRGGSCVNDASGCRTALRGISGPSGSSPYMGFRTARSSGPSSTGSVEIADAVLDTRSWTLALSAYATTHGTVQGAGSYLSGTSASLLATPNPGYVFTGWTGATSGSDNPIGLLMNANKSVVANFSPDLADDDRDGLNNYKEVVVYGTDPTKQDSDGDGFNDAFEVNTGFNPAIPGSTPDGLATIRTPDALSSIPAAVEFRFNAANGVNYRIEASTDLNEWTTIETVITGEGGVVTRFYSIENQPKRYFRVRRN